MKNQRLPNIHATAPATAGAAFGIACGSKALRVRPDLDWLMYEV